METGTRLAIGATIVVSVTAYMAYRGASSSWQYYLTVDECLAKLTLIQGDPVRVSGSVAAASLQVAAQRDRARFRLAGQNGSLDVDCAGPVPDNLEEGRDVVVEGRVGDDGILRGDRVLTRCASKYASVVPVAEDEASCLRSDE